jgi:hypothetical protein
MEERMSGSKWYLLAVIALAMPPAWAQTPAGGGITPKSIALNNDLNKDGVITKAEATKAAGGLIRNWAQYDIDYDDKVTTDELVNALGGAGQPTVKSVADNNDLNKDGVITKAEATKAAGGLIKDWAQYDVNKDDKVTSDEVVKALRGTGAGSGAQPTVKSIADNNDLNKDGVITKAEAAKAAGVLIQSWAQYDVNKDDKVTSDELTKGLTAVLAEGKYSTIGAILADPAAKAVLKKHVPGVLTHPKLNLILGWSLREAAAYPEANISVEKFNAIVAELGQIK